jgi:outer membrane protein TolC
MRIRYRVGVVSIALAATILGAIAGHAATTPAPAPTTSFAQQRLEISQRALELGKEMYARGLSSDVPELATWSRRVMEAQRELAANDDERNRVVQDYLARMKELESLAESRLKAGLGTEYDTLSARFMRVEAEEMAAGKR